VCVSSSGNRRRVASSLNCVCFEIRRKRRHACARHEVMSVAAIVHAFAHTLRVADAQAPFSITLRKQMIP
jgi:hypothetical protein